MNRREKLAHIHRPVITIVGPTASGKSSLAIRVAEVLKGEVISADSMQIYRHMNIGTAKVDVASTSITHYGIDIVDPGEPYSAQLFQQYARTAILEINSRDHVPIICGGTGFYIQAVLEDMQFPAGEQTDNPVRDRYQKYLDQNGKDALWDLLNQKDPESAAVIHPNNSRRVIRALEMHEEGVSYAEQSKNIKQLPHVVPSVRFGLRVSPHVLSNRINERVDSMISQGLIDEVQELLQSGFEGALTAPQAIGYKEIVSYLKGNCTLDEAIEQIKTATRRYAKRQRSWFRRDKSIMWLDAESCNTDQLTHQICDKYEQVISTRSSRCN